MLKKISFFILIILTYSYSQAKFLLIMGPSGAGKSTIIRHLKELDARFVYVAPLTTRPLRDNEQDKIHVDLDEINRLDKDNQLLAINNLYGIYYATPKYIIDQALSEQQFPILDWPIEKIDVMEKKYTDNIFRVYIEPESRQELKRRLLLDNRDRDGKRYTAGVEELTNLYLGKYDQNMDLRLINEANSAQQIAQNIYKHFLSLVAEIED